VRLCGYLRESRIKFYEIGPLLFANCASIQSRKVFLSGPSCSDGNVLARPPGKGDSETSSSRTLIQKPSSHYAFVNPKGRRLFRFADYRKIRYLPTMCE